MGWGPGLDIGGGGKPDGAGVVSNLISCFVSSLCCWSQLPATPILAHHGGQ